MVDLQTTDTTNMMFYIPRTFIRSVCAACGVRVRVRRARSACPWGVRVLVRVI